MENLTPTFGRITPPMFNAQALAAMLKGFGIDVEEIKRQAQQIINSGAADKIVKAVETLERVESKLDKLIALHTERTQTNGEPTGNESASSNG